MTKHDINYTVQRGFFCCLFLFVCFVFVVVVVAAAIYINVSWHGLWTGLWLPYRNGGFFVVAFSSHARILGRIFNNSFSACAFFFFFLSGNWLAHTYSILQARISPQWLSELRRL